MRRPACVLVGNVPQVKVLVEALRQCSSTTEHCRDAKRCPFESYEHKVDYVFLSTEFKEKDIRETVKRAKENNSLTRVILLDLDHSYPSHASSLGAHSLIDLTPENAGIVANYWASCLYPP